MTEYAIEGRQVAYRAGVAVKGFQCEAREAPLTATSQPKTLRDDLQVVPDLKVITGSGVRKRITEVVTDHDPNKGV